MIDRRTVLKAIAGSVLLDRIRDSGAAGPVAKSLERASARGRRFLRSLFDPALGLLPEYRGSKVYWLYHDNYLAAKVLAHTDPALARKIRAAIRGHGITQSGKIEILFGEARKALPLRHPRLVDVKQVGDKLVKTEFAGQKVFKGWQEYADLLFLAAIASAQTDPKQARHDFDQGMQLWDGVGFKDRVAKRTGIYATYKIALALAAACQLKLPPAGRAARTEMLLRQQAPDGGWATDYDGKGKPLSQANVETTALAILALDRLGAAAADQPGN